MVAVTLAVLAASLAANVVLVSRYARGTVWTARKSLIGLAGLGAALALVALNWAGLVGFFASPAISLRSRVSEYIGLLVLFTSLFVNCAFLFRHVWVTPSKGRAVLARLCLLGVVLLSLFLVLEGYYRFLFIQSDGFTRTRSGELWAATYFHPLNSFGYRDVEHNEASLAGKKVAFVVGDSIAAGAGINDYKDRFSNILGERLGAEWVVVNIAQCGWSTKEEYRAIRTYPHNPALIILSYCYNDLEGVAIRMGKRPFALPGAPGVLRPLVERSFFVNFVYWRLYRSSAATVGSYWKFIEECLGDEAIWKAHEEDLLGIIDHARGVRADLVVVVWPELTDTRSSAALTSKVVPFLRGKGVKVMDLTLKLAGREPRELVVNAVDSHPNVKVHREVALDLLELIGGQSPAAADQ
jgi:hypothetical protein